MSVPRLTLRAYEPISISPIPHPTHERELGLDWIGLASHNRSHCTHLSWIVTHGGARPNLL